MRQRPRPDFEDGFTLVELLVVVIVLGILAAIAIPVYLSQRERGWQAQLTADVRNAILDVEAGYVANNGRYPVDQAAFDALGPEISDPSISLSYTVSAAGDAFCVEGTDVRLPPGREVASYVNGRGVAYAVVCPPL